MYELSDRIIIFDTGLTLKELETCKEELSSKISFYKGFVYVRNAEKYDPIRGENNTLLKTKDSEFLLIPDEIKKYFDAPSMPHRSPSDGRNGNGIGKGIGNVERESAERERPINLYINRYNELFGKQAQATIGRTDKLRTRLQTYSMEKILEALSNLARSPYHRGKNENGWFADADFLIRTDEMVDKWLNAGTLPAKKKLQIPDYLKDIPNSA